MIYISNKDEKIEYNTVVTIGNFDGLHIGHQKLIKYTKFYSKEYNLKSVVLSFYPHPIKFLRNIEFDLISPKEEKRNIIESYFIDYYVEYSFDEHLSNNTAKDFIEFYLYKKLNCKFLIVGEDYKLGKDGLLDKSKLEAICNLYNIKLKVVPTLFNNNKKISSTEIKINIKNNNLNLVRELLGRPYSIYGKVEKGAKLGRTIGFPTINLKIPENKVLLVNGVYFTNTLINNKYYDSVTNIGVKPTIGGKNDKTIETYIIDFNQDIYDNYVTILFYDFIRKEIKFKNIDELKKQIKHDVKDTISYFQKNTT